MAELPKDIHVGALLKSRIKEISGLAYVISGDIKHGKLASQQVPRHMRRRAVSHDVRRLPRRLREKYLREKKQGGGDVPAGKRPSRKYRRRAGNLLLEYNRRQMKIFWLETHIWHAKRFHMAEKWGYKIPDFPNDKCWRACYRATKNSSLMFDISYLNLIQIKGRANVLLPTLNKMAREETGKVFDPPAWGAEKSAVLFDPEGFAIGDVTYLWLPCEQVESVEDDLVMLWIFAHPAFVSRVIKELKTAFDIPIDCDKTELIETMDMEIQEDPSQAEPSEPERKRMKLDPSTVQSTKNVNQLKMATRHVPAHRAPSYTSSFGTQLIDFQGTINRFRLVGPSSVDILRSVCKPAHLEGPKAADAKQENSSSAEQQLNWWHQYYADQGNLHDQNQQTATFLSLKNHTAVAGFDQNIALTVRDPRLLLPVKKLSPNNLDKPSSDLPNAEDQPSGSGSGRTASPGEGPAMASDRDYCWTRAPFFNSQIRDSATFSKCADAEINRHRSNLLIPGTSLNLGENESRVPVLILTQLEGLDLLVPAGWGMSFWQCLVYHGCRVGGDRELNHLSIEQGVTPLLTRHPESLAAQLEAATTAEALKKAHFALPPKKRVNFSKLGIAAPFMPPWTILLRDWEREDLVGAQLPPQVDENPRMKVLLSVDALARVRAGDFSAVSGTDVADSLVAVRLKVERRGRLGANTLICLPTAEDLAVEDVTWEGPVDSLQSDAMEEERKQTRELHQSRKQQLKRQWKKLKDKQVLMKAQAVALGKPLDTDKLNLVTSNMDTLKKIRDEENLNFGAKTEDLWIGDFSTVRHSCRREVLGYVTTANMSYRLGCFVGFGFVTLKGLQKLQELGNNPKSLVLTRETSSLQYRFSSLSIL